MHSVFRASPGGEVDHARSGIAGGRGDACIPCEVGGARKSRKRSCRSAVIILGSVLLGTHPRPAATFGAEILVGLISGRVGESVALPVRLESTSEEEAKGVQHEILLTRAFEVAVNDRGQPDCFQSPDLRLSDSAFSFRPEGCVPGHNCEQFRGLVLELGGPFDPGTILLYQCMVSLTRVPPCGTEPLRCENAIVSNSRGERIPVVCVDGSVTVLPLPGDCDEDGQTTIDEIIRATLIVLGEHPVDYCEAADTDLSGTVTVEEVVSAVKTAMGCP
jgi:hypothetical protein